MRITGLLLVSLSVLGWSSATLLVADNVLSTLGRNVFEFDHFRPDINELMKHPYMREYRSLDYGQDSVEHMLSNIYSKSRVRRSTNTSNPTDTPTDTVAEEKLLIVTNGTFLPSIGLEVKFNFPLVQVYESTFLSVAIPINFNLPLFAQIPITGREWSDEIQPALDDLEGLVSMLGLDGRSCVLRAVCEIAESPFIRPEGIVGEMLEIFVNHLTMETSESNEIEDGGEILSRRRREYSEASLKGQEKGDCAEHYSTCPVSLFNIRTAELF